MVGPDCAFPDFGEAFISDHAHGKNLPLDVLGDNTAFRADVPRVHNLKLNDDFHRLDRTVAELCAAAAGPDLSQRIG